MVALRCGDVVRVPLTEATSELKLVDQALYDVAKVFFG
jgi:6-phosphofructokinase 1